MSTPFGPDYTIVDKPPRSYVVSFFRTALIVFILFSMCFSLHAGKKPDPKKIFLPDFKDCMSMEKTLSRTSRFGPGGKIIVKTGYMGNVTVIGWNRPEVKVDAVVTVYGRSQKELEENINKIQCRYTRTEVLIQILTEHAPNFSMGRVDYTIMVPSFRTDMMINSLRGYISIDNVNGWIEGDTVIGYLSFKNLSGYIAFTSYNGDILCQLKGKRWEGLRLNAVTTSGDIKVFMPADYSVDLLLMSLKGEVTADYPNFLNEEEEEIPVTPQRKKQEGMFINQRIRKGGPPVILQTTNGLVSLKKFDSEVETLTTPGSESTNP